MFFVSTVEQTDLLISICFYFFFVTASLWFSNAATFSRLMGISFISPFILYLAAFLANKKIIALSILSLSESSLFILILAVYLIKTAEKHLRQFLFLASAFSILLVFLCHSFTQIQEFLSEFQNPLILLLALLSALLYFLRKENTHKGNLFWAVLLVAISSHPVGMINVDDSFSWVRLAIKITAFSLFAYYFHNEYMVDMLTRIEEANKKQSVIKRSIEYEVKKRVLEIERINENLVKKTKIDAMTRMLNKVAIYDAIESQIISRPKMEFSILMFDIDNFKNINDNMGHLAGDKCIKTMAMLTRNSFRDFDIIGRYGGDEFIVLLPGAKSANTIMVAERFRKKVEEQTNPKMTISMGIAAYPECGLTVKELLQAADTGLYRSKEKGRNAVSFMNVY